MTDRTSDASPGLASRRTVLRGAALAGVAVPFLAACSDASSDNSTTDGGSRSGSGDPTSDNPPPDGGGAGEAIASTADVPEGGGVILDDPKVVITQPASGTFKGFSSICTHQGCPLDNVSDGTINCTCHGSQFSIDDGSVVGGPAESPLPEQPLEVKGGKISLA